MKTHWLNRDISAPGPYLCLCKSEAEFNSALKKLKVYTDISWLANSYSHATTHYFESQQGLATVVCIDANNSYTTIQIYALLVHEAVHVWQEWCRHIGEHTPGLEQEAYAIQQIAQNLMIEFERDRPCRMKN